MVKPPVQKISHRLSTLFFSSPVSILINLPVPSIRSVAAAADLDDLTALGEVIQRTLDGGLADIRALRHDLCLCDFAKVVMDDVTDTVGFAAVLIDDFDPVREFPVSCKNDTQLIGHERNIVVFFLVLQIVYLKLPWKKLKRMAIGIAYTLVGLVMFLTSVSVGFMPIGYKMGTMLAENNSAVVIAFGFVIGAVVVLAEPAVHVLNKQVEEITEGTVSRRSMMIALSIGVGLSICLSIIRIIFDFNIMLYLIPGYMISLGLSFFVPGLYTAIAFDSGGVASGPLTSTFILPFLTSSRTARNIATLSLLVEPVKSSFHLSFVRL